MGILLEGKEVNGTSLGGMEAGVGVGGDEEEEGAGSEDVAEEGVGVGEVEEGTAEGMAAGMNTEGMDRTGVCRVIRTQLSSEVGTTVEITLHMIIRTKTETVPHITKLHMGEAHMVKV